MLGLLASSATEMVTLTPDLDVYVEELLGANDDVAAVRFADDRCPPPPGVPRDLVYRFARQPTRAELVRAHTAALAAAEEGAAPRRRRRGAIAGAVAER